MTENISQKNCSAPPLEEGQIGGDPFALFSKWFAQALEVKPQSAHAMVLSTVNVEQVSARVVLLKDHSKEGFTFYTNYRSNKSKQLEQNPQASLLFYWEFLEKQIRIEGHTQKISREKSQAYFGNRPRQSQIAAHASEQSQRLSSRKELERRYRSLEKEFQGKEVPCPEHWGGYRLTPHCMEFWQGQVHRLHDRIIYSRVSQEKWEKQRLAP